MNLLPDRLVKILRNPTSTGNRLQLNDETAELTCVATGSTFPVTKGVPNLMAGSPVSSWDLDEVIKMGESYLKRANGELPEKESSKSFARVLGGQGIYAPGDTVLDIGCASGHFLRSFRDILDPDIRYTGIDATLLYLEWGAEYWGIDDRCAFVHCDALTMPFADDAFDITVVNLFQAFPDIEAALRETMRVTRKMVLWRTPIGPVNYMTKVVYNKPLDEMGTLTPNREDIDYTLYMIYSRQYVEEMVSHLGGRVTLFERDTDFGEFDNTTLENMDGIPATRVVNGVQINGSLVLDWTYVGIDCGGS